MHADAAKGDFEGQDPAPCVVPESSEHGLLVRPLFKLKSIWIMPSTVWGATIDTPHLQLEDQSHECPFQLRV